MMTGPPRYSSYLQKVFANKIEKMVFCSDGICIYITLFMQQCVDVKDFNVWIVPSDETSTLQIRYYLYDRRDDL